MAAAIFNRLADPRKARAISAGSHPEKAVYPEVIDAMSAIDVDLSHAQTRKLTPAVAQQAQVVVTMGCGDECPHVPDVKRDDWAVEDPRGKQPGQIRAIRDDIARRVKTLIESNDWGM
jgi:arsenate reductase